MNETAQQILNVAQDLVRCRGYSAFSYADISEQVGIRKASIHYHFPSKNVLAQELVKRYRTVFQQKLTGIERSESDPRRQLQSFVGLYRIGLSDCQICLCGMLSAEIEVLSEPVKQEIRAFLSTTQNWLEAVLTTGEATGCLQPRMSPETESALFLATLQGAQLMARTAENSEAIFDEIAQPLLETLCLDG